MIPIFSKFGWLVLGCIKTDFWHVNLHKKLHKFIQQNSRLLYCSAALRGAGRRVGAWKPAGGVSRAPTRLDFALRGRYRCRYISRERHPKSLTHHRPECVRTMPYFLISLALSCWHSCASARVFWSKCSDPLLFSQGSAAPTLLFLWAGQCSFSQLFGATGQ